MNTDKCPIKLLEEYVSEKSSLPHEPLDNDPLILIKEIPIKIKEIQHNVLYILLDSNRFFDASGAICCRFGFNTHKHRLGSANITNPTIHTDKDGR